MWTEDEQRLLLGLKKQCLIHMFLQSTSAYINHAIQSSISIPNIIIGGVLSVTIFSTTSHVWRVTTGVLAVLSTILSSLQRQLAAGERGQLHASAVRSYQMLVRDINMHLSFNMDDQEKIDFIREVKSEMDKIFTIQPDPSILALKFFQKRYSMKIETALFDDFEKMITDRQFVPTSRVSRYPKMSNRYSVAQRIWKYINKEASPDTEKKSFYLNSSHTNDLHRSVHSDLTALTTSDHMVLQVDQERKSEEMVRFERPMDHRTDS